MEKFDPEVMVRFLVFRAQGHMATTRLHKMAYLASLMGVDREGAPATDLTFIRNTYGPWSPPLAQVIEDVEAPSEDIEVATHEIPTGTARFFKARERGPEGNASVGAPRLLESLWSSWGYVPTKIIVAYCKGSKLFTGTASKAVIDFSPYAKKRSAALGQLSKAKLGDKVTLPVEGYSWVVRVESEGLSAQCEELPACITQANGREELEMNMREALLSFWEAKVSPREVAA